MSAASSPASFVGTILRVGLAGFMIALAVGFPAFGVASALGGDPLALPALLKAAAFAAVGAGISVLGMRVVVRDIWTAWVGLLGGVMPASIAAPRSLLLRLALAHLVGGGLLIAAGLRVLGLGGESASAVWTLFGMCLALAGLGLALGGALPRLWWARRGCGVEQPDDTVSRHLGRFAWLALGALSLSSGLAHTLASRPDASGQVPLRRGEWVHDCVSTLAETQDICPSTRRYVARARAPGRMRLEWRFAGACEIEVEQDGAPRVLAAPEGFLPVDLAPGSELRVTVDGLQIAACHFSVRVRPAPEGGP